MQFIESFLQGLFEAAFVLLKQIDGYYFEINLLHACFILFILKPLLLAQIRHYSFASLHICASVHIADVSLSSPAFANTFGCSTHSYSITSIKPNFTFYRFKQFLRVITNSILKNNLNFAYITYIFRWVAVNN